ncbi:MAG: transcriptional regulator GlxA family with amidase domain [Planctomycetota bacterium]
MTTIGILLFEGAEELDFVGPWEVFTATSMLREEAGESGDTVVTISQQEGPIPCAKGLRVLADHTLGNHPALDVVLIPGGMGTRREVGNQVLLDWIAGVASTATWTTSVCTGSLLLHRSGVGKNKRLATHRGAEDLLESFGDVTVVRNARWVRDGDVVSSQGVSAGIDMALWLVGQIHGVEQARRTQEYIQYDPAPPYQADV